MAKNISLLILLVFCQVFNLSAQPIQLKFHIHNQPNSQTILNGLKGNQISPVDSLLANDSGVSFQLPQNYPVGIYRLILGQTLMAKVMNEAPQHLDFIFNGEDIEIETDFNAPLDSAKVIRSVENQVWFAFLKKEKDYQQEVNELVMQINYFQKNSKDSYYTEAKKNELTENYNKLQHEREELITSIPSVYPELFATKLTNLYRKPIQDAYLFEEERKKIYRTQYFDDLDFNDESILNSPVYNKKVFKYIMLTPNKDCPNRSRNRNL